MKIVYIMCCYKYLKGDKDIRIICYFWFYIKIILEDEYFEYVIDIYSII